MVAEGVQKLLILLIFPDRQQRSGRRSRKSIAKNGRRDRRQDALPLFLEAWVLSKGQSCSYRHLKLGPVLN